LKRFSLGLGMNSLLDRWDSILRVGGGVWFISGLLFRSFVQYEYLHAVDDFICRCYSVCVWPITLLVSLIRPSPPAPLFTSCLFFEVLIHPRHPLPRQLPPLFHLALSNPPLLHVLLFSASCLPPLISSIQPDHHVVPDQPSVQGQAPLVTPNLLYVLTDLES